MKKSSSAGKAPRRREPADLAGDLDVLDSEAAARFAAAEVELRDSRVTGVGLEDLRIARLRLDSCALERVALGRAVIRTAKWSDVRMTECDLANAEITGLTGVRVELLGCRMTGLRLGETAWQSLLIQGGDQRYAQFRFSKFQWCEFVECDFQDADFYGADLRGCVFRGCRLNQAEMTQAQLMDTDVRGSSLDGVRMEAADARGLIVDPGQALELAPLLGIVIR